MARYEAGIPETADEFYGNKEGAQYYLSSQKNATAKIKDLAPVSKKGYPVWNFISQINSIEVAKNMYPGHSYLIDSHAWNYICASKFSKADIDNSNKIGNYYDNTTTKYEELDVLYAVHEDNNGWSYADGTNTGEGSQYHKGLIPPKTAPKAKGNKRLELATGASDDFKVYNIYDMAGNVWEWTTETGTNHCTDNRGYYFAAVRRGGSFNYYGSVYPVVHAHASYRPNDCLVFIGFRVVLYL